VTRMRASTLYLFAAVVHADFSSNDYVLVPGGQKLHRSCVHEVPAGSAVSHAHDGALVFTSPGRAPIVVGSHCGIRLLLALCSIALSACCPLQMPRCAYPAKANVTHGAAWKAWAQHVPTGSEREVSYLNGSWPVPPEPTDTSAGQTLFFWNGIEPTDTSAVLQPVLQWGVYAAS
jgi:hypothetical protein